MLVRAECVTYGRRECLVTALLQILIRRLMDMGVIACGSGVDASTTRSVP